MPEVAQPPPRKPPGRPKAGRPKDPRIPLPDKKRELFAKSVAAGVNQRQSAIDAGFHANPNSAAVIGHRLMREPYIANRVNFLRERAREIAIESLGLTRADILRKLAEIIVIATKTGELSAANRALELIGREIGMFVERKIIGVQALIAELTPENLRSASADELLRLVGTIESTLSLPEVTSTESVT